MSNEAKEILDRYWDLLLPVKVDDIANRCGICIRPLDESLCQNFSGMASLDKDSGDKVIYYKYAGTEVELDDEEYIIVKQNDILAVIR